MAEARHWIVMIKREDRLPVAIGPFADESAANAHSAYLADEHPSATVTVEALAEPVYPEATPVTPDVQPNVARPSEPELAIDPDWEKDNPEAAAEMRRSYAERRAQ